MPVKYQPDNIYLRHVKLSRVHLFTLIQLFCFAVMWVIKSIRETSITFPVMVNTPLLSRSVISDFAEDIHVWGAMPKFFGWAKSLTLLPVPSPSFPFPPLSPAFSPSLHLEVGPLRERSKLSLRKANSFYP